MICPTTLRGPEAAWAPATAAVAGRLPGVFAAAQRWEWIDRNPAESVEPPGIIREPIPAT